MDDFKKLTEQLLKIYINADSANDLGIENYFDENISLIGTGKHELYRNLHEFLESFKFDVKRRGKIRIEVRNLHQEEERLDDDHVLAYGTVDFVGLFKDGSSCFEMETRFTIIYKRANGKWLVQHLHQSAPDLEQMDGEEFPLTLGKQVKKTRQALQGLGTAYYHISRLNLKTKKVELVKRSRKMELDIKDNIADWDPQFKIIEGVIAEPFVQKYIDFFDLQTMAARLHNKESMSSEFKKKDGSWFLSMVVPQSYDKNGKVTSVLIANRDVTEEKLRELRQEEELREAKLKAECANKAKSSFLFNITDNGIGMSEDFQKHIFEIFERERNSTVSHIEGSGIGMGITKKLVDLMDGTIEVKSKQGEGSIFTVTVPCRKASKEDSMMKKKSNLRNKNCLNGVRILLVEDNEINAEIATELLTEEGCIVETANDGVACIDMIEKADADYYKMILMDIQMPVMNGYDATLAIRKMKDTKKAGIPIIAMTANVFAEDIQKVLSVGMNAHVTKPVDMNILVPTMMKYL